MQSQRATVGESGFPLGIVLVVLSVVTVWVIVWWTLTGGALVAVDGAPAEGVPVAGFTWAPGAPNAGDPVTFDAGATTHPENATGYAWDFDGDGEPDASGRVATHTFAERGNARVALTVTDVHGAAHTTRQTVTVNGAPMADAGSDKVVEKGSTVTWTLEIADPDSTSWRVTVDYGDGKTVSETTDNLTVPLAHEYAAAGEYHATVTVTDDGGMSSSDTFVVDIQNTPPRLALSSDIAPEGFPTTVSATFTDRADDTHTARVDWGDGVKENLTVTPTADGGVVEATHIYEDDGDYSIVVSVTDDSGARAVSVLPAEVANRAPSIDTFSMDTSIVRGDATHLEVAFSDLGLNDSHTARVNWGDGTVETVDVWQSRNTIDAYHTYRRTGTYTVTLTITDDEGASVRRTARIGVR